MRMITNVEIRGRKKPFWQAAFSGTRLFQTLPILIQIPKYKGT